MYIIVMLVGLLRLRGGDISSARVAVDDRGSALPSSRGVHFSTSSLSALSRGVVVFCVHSVVYQGVTAPLFASSCPTGATVGLMIQT
jgi:hypothetical protein